MTKKIRLKLPPGISVKVSGQSRDFIEVPPEKAATVEDAIATLARLTADLTRTLEHLDDEPPATHH